MFTFNGLASLFRKNDFSLRKKLSSKKYVFEVLTSPSSHKSNYENYKDLLAFNNPLNKLFARLFETSSPKASTDIVQYTKKDLEQII